MELAAMGVHDKNSEFSWQMKMNATPTTPPSKESGKESKSLKKLCDSLEDSPWRKETKKRKEMEE
eukprot:3624288-Karenia_brevis.AAC.1